MEVDHETIQAGPDFHAGAVFVDGEIRDEIDGIVLRDRRVLAEDGMISATVLVSQHEGTLLDVPELVARGVLHESASEEVLARAAAALQQFLEDMELELLADLDATREEVRLFLRRWCRKHIGRRPMVLPVVVAV